MRHVYWEINVFLSLSIYIYIYFLSWLSQCVQKLERMKCQRNLRLRHCTLHACCCDVRVWLQLQRQRSLFGAAASEAEGMSEFMWQTEWNTHCVCVSVCECDSVLYVSQWIVFNVARLRLPAWTSSSAFPLFIYFFKPLFIHRGSSERSAVFLQERVIFTQITRIHTDRVTWLLVSADENIINWNEPNKSIQ